MKSITNYILNDSNEKIQLDDIHDIFSKSEYGKVLKDRIRYSEFKPSGILNNEWVRILGPDVNNLDHLYFTYLLTRKFLMFNRDFSEEDSGTLLISALIHDWGETVIGDIRFPSKNESHNVLERIYIKRISGEVLNNLEIEEKIDKVITEVFNGDNFHLRRAFDSIERQGYLLTGIRAWKMSDDNDTELSVNLRSLASEVVVNHYEVLKEYSKEFDMIRRYLEVMDDVIDEIQYSEFYM